MRAVPLDRVPPGARAEIVAFPHLEPAPTAAPPRSFWDGQPAPVRAVLDLAWLREGGHHDPMHDRILDTFTGQHADAIREIAHLLDWVERLDCEPPGLVLADYHEGPVFGVDLDRRAERLAEQLRGEALTNAQLVASLIVAGTR